MKRLGRKPTRNRALRKIGRILQSKRMSAEPAPAVRSIQASVRDHQPLSLKPRESLGDGKADLSLPFSRIRWLTGNIEPKLVVEVTRVVPGAKVWPTTNEKEQLGGEVLRSARKRHIGVRDGRAELKHAPYLAPPIAHDKDVVMRHMRREKGPCPICPPLPLVPRSGFR
jgi:hypothetical protein